jgi:hypothetical protein
MSDLDDLRDELVEFAAPKKEGGLSAREERIIAGFEDIQRFFEQQGRLPENGDDKDIFERLYAVRLDRMRELEECRSVLAAFDHHGWLAVGTRGESDGDDLDDADLLAELTGIQETASLNDLRYVRSSAEKRAAEEIATQQPCKDFDRFAPLFEKAQRELKSGERQARPFAKEASIRTGDFFILSGQMVYVAGIGEYFKAPNGEQDARLRAIYSNGTESNLLQRSLQRALYKDEAGRRLSDPNAGPLFSDVIEPEDIDSGFIYVLRSRSSHPFIVEHRELIHKIGVTSRTIESRIASAALSSTFLFADVEVIASYKLAGVNRTRLENLFHRIFAQAQLELTLHDPFGAPLKPREWFLVPLNVIDEVMQRILDGSITNVVYDPATARLVAD